jgi:aminopeptidase N
MDSDNIKAVEKLTGILKQVKAQIGDNPQAKMMIRDILKKGLDRKMKVFRENPSNQSLNSQVELINKTVEAYNE